METILNIQDQYSIQFVYTKHLSHRRYKYDSRNDILIFMREILCECITKNLNLQTAIDYCKSLLNVNDDEMIIILNGEILNIVNFTLLDVAMKNWSIGAYDSLHFGSNIINYFYEYPRLDDVKLLISLGAKTILQMTSCDLNSIYCIPPVDNSKMLKYVYGKLLYSQDRELLYSIRKFNNNTKKQRKFFAKGGKKRRTEIYRSKTFIEYDAKRQQKIKRRQEWVCCICLDNNNHKSKYVLPNCKHKFHAECIFKYVTVNVDNNRCPFCRTSFLIT